jgi:fatty acid desaturase
MNKTINRQNPTKSFARNAAALVFVGVGMMAFFFGQYLESVLGPSLGVERTLTIGGIVWLILVIVVGIPLAFLTYKIVGYLEKKYPIKKESKGNWICPKCSKSNLNTSFKCSKCGYTVV